MKYIRFFVLLCFCLMSLSGGYAAFSAVSDNVFDNPGSINPAELYRMARSQMASGNLDKARLYALRLYFDGRRNPNLLNLLGVIEVQTGRTILASEWFRRTLCLNPGDRIAQRYISRLPSKPQPIPVDPYALAEHFVEIENTLPKILPRLTSERLHAGAILRALERGQFYLALALSEQYENKYDGFDGVDGAALTALCAWYLGRNRDAMMIVENGLKKEPYHDILLFVKAMITDRHPATSSTGHLRALYDQDQWQRVLSMVDRYSRTFSQSPDAYMIKARIMLDLYRTDAAAEALQKAAMRDPGNTELDLMFVDLFLQRGQTERAETRLERAFRRGYHLPSVNLTAGLFASQRGRVNELNVILNDAYNSRPFTDPSAYPLYVSLLLGLENMVEAREALDEWRSRAPMRSMICYIEAFYYFKLGDNEKALNYLRRAFRMNPNRLNMVYFMVSFPALEDDPELKRRMRNRLAEAGFQGF